MTPSLTTSFMLFSSISTARSSHAGAPGLAAGRVAGAPAAGGLAAGATAAGAGSASDLDVRGALHGRSVDAPYPLSGRGPHRSGSFSKPFDLLQSTINS